MTRIVLDAGMLERFRNLSERTEVCDESGQTLGYFHPTRTGDAAARCPYSREELERFRQERPGRPLMAVLKDLSQLGSQRAQP